jgi:hypothetical protein
MNRWLIMPGVLTVALAASVPPAADTQGCEGGIAISDNVASYNWGGSAAAPTQIPIKAVALGQTIEQVDQTLGAPQKILKAGAKVIYVYQGLKVIFENGKAAAFE